MHGRAPHLFVLIFVMSLSACAGNRGIALPELAQWKIRKAVLERTDEWAFSGRMGVRAGDDGFNGKLWWRQDGTVFRARISGPLGIGTIFINGDGPEITLTDRDGVVTELDDAEVELRQRYGWTIPVGSLRFWALGIPDPDIPSSVKFNAAEQMSELQQQRWTVTIGQYAPGGGQSMPRRLTAVDDDIRVRLVIDEWTFR